MPPSDRTPADLEREVGLCATCRHSRQVPAPQAVYWLCRRSATDPRYPKYPRLPVMSCAGYERGSET